MVCDFNSGTYNSVMHSSEVTGKWADKAMECESALLAVQRQTCFASWGNG